VQAVSKSQCQGKLQSVITIAIAREILAFMWAIAKKVQITGSVPIVVAG
jgi:hypothetical protein